MPSLRLPPNYGAVESLCRVKAKRKCTIKLFNNNYKWWRDKVTLPRSSVLANRRAGRADQRAIQYGDKVLEHYVTACALRDFLPKLENAGKFGLCFVFFTFYSHISASYWHFIGKF